MLHGGSMNRERILAVLYDLTSTIGGEVSLEPLITKTLQCLMRHAGYPCGLMFLNHDAADGDRASFELAVAIGDSCAIKQTHQIFHLPDALTGGKPELLHSEEVIKNIPCHKEKYKFVLKLPVDDKGVILLLASNSSQVELPLEQMLVPVMSHFSKAFHLCQLNDMQKEMLKREVEQRTREIYEREEQMRLLLASTAEGIFGLDVEGRCSFANASALRLLGYERADELVGKVIHDLLHHTRADGTPHPAADCQIMKAARERKEICVNDELFWRKDGSSIPVEYRSIPIRKEGEDVGQIISFIDISDRLEAERVKLENRVKLEHSQRLESLGVLAGGIAHDFNNLLTAIMGNAALAQQKIDRSSDAYGLIDRVNQASQSAAGLCQQMLAYSGKGKFTIRAINLSDLVDKMSKLLEVSINKNALLKYDLRNDLPCIEADQAQLQQVIMNLITNANEALEGKNGVISISTGVTHVDQTYLNSSYLHEELLLGDYIYLEVSDTGCGISEADKERMFEPFFTTKASGRGLGMSALLGIIRGHHGTLKVYTEKGKGTSIKVLLPASEAVIADNDRAEKERVCAHGETVLVTDDEPMLREVAESMLKSADFNVITAADGQECIEKYLENKDRIAVVLLDMMMPVMNGEETFQRLRLINPNVKVILCSGYNEQDATQKFTGKGLAGFLQKPYSMELLYSTIFDIISRDKE